MIKPPVIMVVMAVIVVIMGRRLSYRVCHNDDGNDDGGGGDNDDGVQIFMHQQAILGPEESSDGCGLLLWCIGSHGKDYRRWGGWKYPSRAILLP